MKSQSLKLFAAAFVFALVTIFAAGNVSAQENLSFKTSFDFHVGKDKMNSGEYRLQYLGENRYWLRNAETNKAVMVYFASAEGVQNLAGFGKLAFNRYGETYFLSRIASSDEKFSRAVAVSKYEKEIRQKSEGEDKLAEKQAKPAQVSVNLSK